MNESILLIILGWLFGLLGAPIVSRIERRYKRNDIKVAIVSELNGLIVRLASNCYRIQMHLGTRDKQSLLWYKTIIEKYQSDVSKDELSAIERLLRLTDNDFGVLADSLKAPDNLNLSIKTIQAPFIESVLADLSLFDSKFQSSIFDIRNQIGFVNEEIENSNFYIRLSFDSAVMKANSKIITDNLNVAYKNIQRRCRIIADKIEQILK